MYLMEQSCLHEVINFSRPPTPDQNMPHFSLFHRPLQNSAKFRGNTEILQKQANSAYRGQLWSILIGTSYCYRSSLCSRSCPH